MTQRPRRASSARRPIRFRSALIVPLLAAVLALDASIAPRAADHGPSTAPAVHAQGATITAFPDVQTRPIRYASPFLTSDGAAEAEGPAGAEAVLGQEGYGRSTIEVANPSSDADATLSLRLSTKFDGREAARTTADLWAGLSTAIDLSTLVDRAGEGRFSARLESTAPVGAIARTRWASGAGVAYEAPETGASLVLPIMVLNLAEQTDVMNVQNATNGDANIEVRVYDPASGDALLSTQVNLGAGETVEWDTSIDRTVFVPSQLTPNVGEGFLGSLRLESNTSVSMLGIVDQRDGPAAAAIVARPVAAADRVQVLPRVWAGADGGSLVAVVNTARQPATAVLRFAPALGEDGGTPPSERTLTLPPYGAAYVDLAPGGARNIPAVAGAVAPFVGAAMVTADAPILAAVLEDRRVEGAVQRLAGYNAFGPRDLSTGWTLPVVRRATGYVSSAVVVHNPTAKSVTARIALSDLADADLGTTELVLPPGTAGSLDLLGNEAFPVGMGRAVVRADGPVAVLGYERRDATRTYELKPLTFQVTQERGSGLAGDVEMTQRGPDLDVSIRMTEGDFGGSFQAYIMKSACSETDPPAEYDLDNVAAGRSLTTLRNLDIRAVANGFYAIRLKRVAGRFGGRVSCGVIPELLGVEVADDSAARAVPHGRGPDALPTAGPTAPPASPTPSATATGRPPSPTAGPSPVATEPGPGVVVGRVHMPVAYTGR